VAKRLSKPTRSNVIPLTIFARDIPRAQLPGLVRIGHEERTRPLPALRESAVKSDSTRPGPLRIGREERL
jgi:hypothetical protein